MAVAGRLSHYVLAERLVEQAREAINEPGRIDEWAVGQLVAMAQVHATLACTPELNEFDR